VREHTLDDPLDGNAPTFSFPGINYGDPNLNVATPVFSTTMTPGARDWMVLSVRSISFPSLASSNCMGKFGLPNIDEQALQTRIALPPVLLQKGQTILAVYGIGNVKDQRVRYELRSNRVRVFTPIDKEDWFNILLSHESHSYAVTLTLASLMCRPESNAVLSNRFPKACLVVVST
jgi:double-strand break repair protein MRE11